MAENKEGDVFENDEEMSFEELFESYDAKMGKELNQGDKVEGRIISIGKKSVYVDTGTKSDGVVEKLELLDENGELPYAVGDLITLFVVSTSESEIILSKAVSGAGQTMMLNDAKASRTPVEGKVSAVIKGGFHVDLMGKRAFCPVSQMDVKYVETPEDYVGKTLPFLITRIEEGGRNIVISRRDLLEEQLEEKRKEFFEKISEDDVIQGTVSKLMGFGAFVELAPGVEGMAHISELSWSRVEKPEDAVRVGEPVTVKILKIEEANEARNNKISLSIKQVSSNPWDNITSLFHTGDQVSGKVVRMTGFGAFVEIAPGIDGLVHISEMSHVKRVVRPEDEVQMGQEVQVVVKSIDPEARRISLSIKDAAGDPWTGVSVRYPKGSVIEGIMEKREAFGLFIHLEPGVTGLLPGSHIREAADSSVFDSLKPGDKIKVMVHEADEENRKLTLSSPDQKDGEDWKQFSGTGGKSSFGSMGDLLKQAMDKKNKKKK